MKRWVATVIILVLAASLLPRPLRAEPSETDRSLAQSLFDQAKELIGSGAYDQACPKLEESQRLDPSGGTLLNLATCHEEQGKVATAWTEFKEALSMARQEARQNRIDAAEEHIRAIEPKLPWLTVSVSSAAQGQEVKIDGALVGQAAWGTAIAVDPGVHEIRAAAPGKEPWGEQVEMAIGERKTVTVPALAAAAPEGNVAERAPPVSGPVSDSEPGREEPRRGQGSFGKTLAVFFGVTGVLGLTVGAAAGISAIDKHGKSNQLCPTDTTCTEEGAKLEDEANTAARVSNISFGIGIASVAAWWLIARASSDSSSAHPTGGLAVEAGGDARGGRVNLKGRF